MESPEKSSSPKAIVCLHAQRDASFYQELQTYFAVWQTQGQIFWAEQTAIEYADLILLLLTPTFLATKRCQRAMITALQERATRGVLVVPVLARVSRWKESACGALKALPDNDRPIAEWRHKERAYENICAGLARLLPDLPALGIAPSERPRLFQARDLPKSYVPRPKAFDAIKQVLLKQEGSQTTAITTALRGAGGFGKTTLALALCHDPEIQAAFPDGILWVELGENPRSLREVLNGILHALEPSLSRSVTPEEAGENFRKVLAERECLLVIDDVWQPSALEPLLEGGPHCKRLVTTRNDQVLPEEAERLLVDAMERTEAIALLCQGLSDAIQQTASQSKLEALVRRLGCWPILLTLAHGLIAERVRRGRTLEQAVETVAQAYQDCGVTAFDVGRATTRHQAIQASIEISLRHFEEFLPARYHARERYQELAAFPEDTNIPLTTLQMFWQATGRLKPWETEDLCIHLHRLSLLLHCDLGAGAIRLHDVMRNYLIQQDEEQLPTLHERLLRAFQQHYHLARWADLPQSETYLWQHLVLHLCQASGSEMLQTTLTDLRWITRKALYESVSALEADLTVASTRLSVHTAFPLVAKLSRRITRISHLLRQAHTEAEMGSLLLLHLYEELATVDQRSTLEYKLPRPFLVAWHPLPDASSPVLLRT
ncbi:MAG TPA: NB-ARC domain-containing protein, partial [Ktedonosporobacter sp.]|nr:NB-ARC domain-containing protein [Ktedonosporobacter sp.]